MDGRGTMDATYLVSGVYLRSHTKDAESAICQRFSCFSTKISFRILSRFEEFPIWSNGSTNIINPLRAQLESCPA